MISSLLRASAIGAVAGLRAVLAPAAVSRAARRGTLDLRQTPLFFLGEAVSPPVFALLAAGELYADQHPGTPSRLGAFPLATRLVSGALCGAAIRIAAPISGALAGAAGAALGAYAGATARSRLARALGADRPAALIEDAVALAAVVLLTRPARR